MKARIQIMIEVGLIESIDQVVEGKNLSNKIEKLIAIGYSQYIEQKKKEAESLIEKLKRE